MNMTIEDKVREFVKSELPLVTNLFMKKIDIDDDTPLQNLHEADDIAEMAEKFFSHFNVQPAGFSLKSYYPWKVKPVFSRKSINQNKIPLTVGMFIASAKAGHWLYN
ncbi:putative phage-associated acyl carrier protein [Yersinia frederiksenii]|nr:putative phage-associated acyl carrier protein [Yersinia frederiksenii]